MDRKKKQGKKDDRFSTGKAAAGGSYKGKKQQSRGPGNNGVQKKQAGGGKRPAAVPAGEHAGKNQKEIKLILAALKRMGKAGGTSRMLRRDAGITDKALFYDTLRALKEQGEIDVDEKHWVTLVPHSGDVEAQLVSLSAGFGFARPKSGGDDIFIHGRALKGAFVGDDILVSDIQKQEKGLSGRVRKVTARSKNTVTGTVRMEEDGAWVVPDGSIRYNLRVKNGDLNGAKDGDKVSVEPKEDYRGDWTGAQVKTVFGSGQSARVCADAIIERCGIPSVFPKAVLAEAEKISGLQVTQSDIDQRLDLREEAIFTIDGADAKDLDDAISVRKTRSGYKLGVHIADVSHYVREKSAIDQEALLRGTSVYFADRVIPMLPEALSNGVCSLNAGEDKLTFSALIDFDKSGNLTKYEFKKTVIHSQVRGVYSEVNEIFAGTASKELLKKYAPVKTGLKNAKELSDILKANGVARGEMELESGETRFVLDENGVCIDLLPRTTGEAEGMIEQMMIAANIAAAKTSLDAKIPFLYRVHEKPQPERVTELYELLDRLGVSCGELKKGVPTTGDFAAVLNRVKGTSKEALVSQRILRTMEKARYAAQELGHFGLALGEYSHFTSPIRRYPDTSIHRILSDLAAGKPAEDICKRYGEFAELSAAESSKNEVRAVTGERAAEDCYMAEYMKAHIGERHMGIISGATPRGIFVRLENNAEGFVSVNDFPNCDFQFDGVISHRDLRSGRTLTVGEEIGIIVASAEVSTGRIDFLPQEE